MSDHRHHYFYQNGHRFRKVQSQPESHFSTAFEDQKSFGDDCGNRYTWHEKANRIHKDIMQEKAACEKMMEMCHDKRIAQSKLVAIAKYLDASHNIQQLLSKADGIEQLMTKTLNKATTEQQSLHQKTTELDSNIAEAQATKKKFNQLKQLEQIAQFKQIQLQQLCQQKSSAKDIESEENLRKIIAQLEQKCSGLKSRKKKAKEQIKQMKDRRFSINQNFSKQQRINLDLTQSIDDINNKIEKQAQIDEKLRIQNLQKMEESEANKLHPADLPFEDLRKLKEKNHELKLIILKVKQAYHAQKQTGTSSIPPQLFQQLEAKIEKSTNYVTKHNKIEKENLQLRDRIKHLKEELEREGSEQNYDHAAASIDKQIEAEEAREIDLKATVKILKREAELVSSKCKKYQKEISQTQYKNEEQKESVCSQSSFQTKRSNVCSENIVKEVINVLKKQTQKQQQNTKNRKKQASNELTITKKGSQNGDFLYVKKPFKKGEFVFTIFYLVVLFVIGYYYNKIRVWFLINH